MRVLAYDALEQSTMFWFICCLKLGRCRAIRPGERLPCDFVVGSHTGAEWEGSVIYQDRLSVPGQ